jgi:hypothetical protein
MKTVQLEDHHPEYVMAVLDARWRKLDKDKGELPLESGYEYRNILSEMQRIEVIQERMRNAE